MNILELLANPKKVRKSIQLAILLPMMVSVVAAIQAAMPAATEAEKRAAALGVVDSISNLLEKRGHVTAEMNEGIDRIAAELYAIVAEGLKQAGISTEALHAHDTDGELIRTI